MSVPKGNQPPNSRILSQVQASQRGPQSIQIARAAPAIQLSDDYLQRTVFSQQSTQPQLRGPLHPQTLPANSNNPHDMSKQPIPSQPGLPNSAALQPQMIFPGQVSTRPQHYYTRQSTPRPISNVSQRPPMNMNMTPPGAPPQAQQTFFQAPIGTNMLTAVPPHMTAIQQPLYMQGGVQQYRTSPYPQQSYPIQAQTQAVYIQGGSQYAFPPPPPSTHNTTVYYASPILSRPPSVPTMGTGQAPIKKEKKLIRIQDPNTERDITDEIMSGGSNNPTPPLSGPPSARETPPSVVTPSSDIAVQFATQVAAVAAASKEQQPTPHHSIIRTAVTSEKFIEVKEPKLCSSKADITINKDVSIHIDTIQNENSSSKLNEVKSNNILTPSFSTPSTTPIIVSLAKDEKLQVEEKISETVQTIKPAITVLPEENKVEEVQPVVQQKFEPENLPTLIKIDPVEKNVSENMVEIKPPVCEMKENIEHDDNLPHENGEVPIGDIAEQTSEKWEHESKDMRKQKGKKKQTYLNRKGESKEGGDMDAFVDKEEVTTPVLPNTVESTLIEDVSSKEEERKVAEKNEENMKVSREFQQNVEKDEDPVIEETAAKIQPILKYNYKEDQWSPLNPEGKRQYDRAFLLHLQSKPMSLKKPEGLPDLEVIKETANRVKPFENRQPGMISRSISTVPDFTPGFVKSSTTGTRGGAPVRGARSQPGKAETKPKKSFTLSISHDVKLNKSENAWKPTHKGPKDVDPEIAKTEDLLKKVRGILNKLTPQKFQTLVTQVNQLNIDTEERLKGVIDLVFEKAIDEPNFSVAYANMCKCLAMMKVPIGGKDTEYVNFRKVLLNKCQKEFEKDISDDLDRERRIKEIEKAESDEKKKVLTEELNEAERKAKRRSLGNIRFIGELFKLNMLTANIMHDCLKKLLSQGDEDSLECLCRLLTTIGKDMETDKGKGANKADNRMDGYFKQMQETVNKKQTSSRVRFMLQDVVELRMCNWVPRRDDNNPKTIDQIHQEAQKEALEREIFLQQPVHRRADDRDKRKRGGGGNTGTTGDDGWNTVSSKSSNRNELNRLKLSKPNLDEIQLGPAGRGFGLWGRGSSGGGTKVTSQESDTKASGPSNRFSALAGEQTTTSVDSRRGVARTSAPSSRDSSKGRGSQLPPSTQRNSKPVPSSQKEREQAIAAVKNIAGGESGRTPADEAENNLNREENRKEDDSVILKGPADISQADIEKSLEGFVDEFLLSSDFNDALLNISELCSASTIHVFVATVINSVLERSSQARREVSHLMSFLVKQKVLTLDQYINGLQQILNMAEEYVIDVPRIWEYLGEVIAPMIEDNSLPLSFLKEAAQPCIEAKLAGILVAEVLHVLVKNLGSHKVGEMWRSSGLQWNDFLSPQQNIQDFVKDKKLEFTVSQGESHVNTCMSSERIKADLDALLKQNSNDNEAIYDWIAVHIGEAQIREAKFIRALVTAVCESAITVEKGNYRVDDGVIRLRSTLLHKYLDHKEEMELQALYALQTLMHKMEHPQGILRQLFEIFYDTDIISEDGFIQWNNSNDPAEQEGRGVAASSVQSFFTWLQEAEESIDES